MYPHERSLVKRLENKPFALLGVNSDRDRNKLKFILFQESITWRSWWDGGTAAISMAWNIQGWPTIFVIDHKGVIRYREAGGPFPDSVVEQLLRNLDKEKSS